MLVVLLCVPFAWWLMMPDGAWDMVWQLRDDSPARGAQCAANRELLRIECVAKAVSHEDKAQHGEDDRDRKSFSTPAWPQRAAAGSGHGQWGNRTHSGGAGARPG